MGEQACGALKIVIRLFRDDLLQVGYRGCEIAHLNCADAAPIKWVRSVGARCDCSIKSLARFWNLAIVHIEIAEFFVVSGRGIVADDGFKLADALAAGEDLERLSDQSDVRERL